MMRKLIRYALYLCGSLLLAVLLYGAAAVLLGNWRIQAQNGAEKADITVYLISNGAHTDIAMPLRHPAFSWARYASPQDTAGGGPNARYIAVGWGDRKFYLETPTWGDLTAATALRAIGGLNPTALHVSFLDDVPPPSPSASGSIGSWRTILPPTSSRKTVDACPSAARIMPITMRFTKQTGTITCSIPATHGATAI